MATVKRVFEIEFDEENGPLWMNRDNLLLCLCQYCQNDRFTVRDLSGDCDPAPASLGPRGHAPIPLWACGGIDSEETADE
jgi:hypothetical protein